MKSQRHALLAVALLVLVAVLTNPALAQTQGEAFNEGKTWADAQKGAAANTINAARGTEVVPGYSTTAPEAALFGGGKGLVGSAGISKIYNCDTSVAPTAYQQQECDVVKYLNKLQATRIAYPVSKTDPLIAASDPVINSPGASGGANGGDVCRIVTQNNPGEYIAETCSTARKTDFPTCTNTLKVTVKWIYSCPVNTVSGPNPDSSDLSVPQRNTCDVADPYYEQSCDNADDVLTITGPSSGFCTNPTTHVVVDSHKKLMYDEHTETASVEPEVKDEWDDKCGSLVERSRLERVPYPECVENEVKQCVQGPETRVIEGLPVTRACWQWKRFFACMNPGFDSGCGPRSNAKCTHTGDICLQFTVDNKCAITQENYSCEKTPPSVTTRTVCEPATFCQGGGTECFSTVRTPDSDFGIAAAAMEAAREGGVYGFNPAGMEFFKGYVEQCSIKVLGGAVLKSCCGSNAGGSAFNNYNLLGAAVRAAGPVARQSVAMGSKYLYDALYGQVDSSLVNKGLSAMNSWATGLDAGALNPSFSFYGFSFSFSMANGFEFVSFDPYSFAFQVALMMVQQWLSCSPPEHTMALKKGENLCVFLGSGCSRKIPIIGTCLEVTETNCCFNSVLAKIINRQGRAQLGLPMYSCAGFNETQFGQLNFATLNFSEFIQSIVPKDADLPGAVTRVTNTVDEKVKNYYDAQ